MEQKRKVAPASYQSVAPYTVVGFKGGYASWQAAVSAGKSAGLPVEDAKGVTIWLPKEMR